MDLPRHARRRIGLPVLLAALAALLVAGEADPPPPVVGDGATADGVLRVTPAVQVVAEGAGTVVHEVANGTVNALELTVETGRAVAGPAGEPVVEDPTDTGTLHLEPGETARLTSRPRGPVTAVILTGPDGASARALAVAAPTATDVRADAAIRSRTGGLRLHATVTGRGGRPAVVDLALRLRQWPDRVLLERQAGVFVVWPEQPREVTVEVGTPRVPLLPLTLDVAAAVRGTPTTVRSSARAVPTGTSLLSALAALAVLAAAGALVVVWRRRR